MSDAPASPFYAPTRLEGLLTAVPAIAAFLVVSHFIGEGKGTVASVFVVSLGCALRIAWPLRKEPWFWMTMLGLTALYLGLLKGFQWSAAADWNGLTTIPFIFADTGLNLAVIYLIYRWRYGVPAELICEPDRRYADQSDCPLD